MTSKPPKANRYSDQSHSRLGRIRSASPIMSEWTQSAICRRHLKPKASCSRTTVSFRPRSRLSVRGRADCGTQHLCPACPTWCRRRCIADRHRQGSSRATAAHVLVEVWNNSNPPHNFPTLLGQAYAALGFKTSQDKPQPGEPPQHGLHRAMFDAACAVNRLRNKQGTGHGHPWLPTVTPEEAQSAAQTMGIVSGMLLNALRERKK